MKQSVELCNLANRFLESLVNGNISFIENMFSKEPGVLAIGSNLNEWWPGYTAIIQGLGSRMSEMGGAKAVDLDIQAYSEGNVGWMVNRFRLKMPDGLEIPFRVTGVFYQTAGEWKIVQWHTSVGISSEEMFEQKLAPPVQTGARQTMSAWAKVIESYDAVPQVYKGFFKTSLGSSQAFPYVVLTPAVADFIHKTTEKLVCEINGSLFVLERDSDQVIVKEYPLEAIRDVEVGIILIHSWITISGVTRAGLAAASTFEFSSATSDRLAPFLNKIRSAINGPEDTGLSAERTKFDYMASLDFKFMNYAKSSLMGSAKVLHTVWQPEIRTRGVALPGWPFHQTISTAHLTILTDKELILIQDDKRVSGNKGVRYGGIWRYIPLRSIVSVALAEQAHDLLTLSIGLSETGHLERVFAVFNQPALEHLRNEIERLIG